MILLNSNRIAYFKNDQVTIITQFNIYERVYETLLLDKEITSGVFVSKEKYGNDLKIATDGHNKWCQIMSDTAKRLEYIENSKPADSIKISLQILCRILYDWTERYNRLYLYKSVDNYTIYLIIESGKHHGHCFYDFIKKEAHSFSDSWGTAIKDKIYSINTKT